jgi:hypothetical protein
VLARTADDKIQGLVVMIVDENERNVVFANLAGTLDLAAIERIGGDMQLPGLDRLGAEAASDDGHESEKDDEDQDRDRDESN